MFLFSFPSGARGGGQEIKESPGGSPSIHISVGVREKGTERERERERVNGKEECESRLLLAAVPAACFIVLAVILFLRYLF